jgi:hypothetical protein
LSPRSRGPLAGARLYGGNLAKSTDRQTLAFCMTRIGSAALGRLPAITPEKTPGRTWRMKMKTLMLNARKLMVTAVLGFALGACATDQDPQPTVDNQPVQIHSAKELTAYLQTAKTTPLDRLSPADRQEFLSSLRFGDKGLGSFKYTALESLSPEDVYQVLSLFGAERNTSMITHDATSNVAVDYKDYECSSRATCRSALFYICLSGCGIGP